MSSLSDECYRFEPKDWLSNCLANFDELRRQQKLCDISVKVSEKRFMGHRIVLSATIPYFNSMFTNGWIESTQTEVEIKDRCDGSGINAIDATAMESLIDFVYAGRIVITETNVQSLFEGSAFLQLDVVRDVSSQYLKIRIHVSNAIGIKSLATAYGCHKLADASKKFIQLNFKEVSKSDEFLSIDFSEINDIVSKDELNVSGEEDVFHAVMTWIKRDFNQRASKLLQLLTNVRLNLLSPEFLSDCLLKEELIRSSDSCHDLVNEAKDYNLIPKGRRRHSLPTRPRFNIKGLIYAFELSLDKFPSLRLGIEVFNPQLKFWEMVETNKEFIDCFGLTVMNNQLYSIGGYDFKSKELIETVEVFDPKNKCWTKVWPMNRKLRNPGATTLHKMIYVCGGYDTENHSTLNSVECYSLAKNEWTTIESMAQRRHYLGIVACEGQVYALGGADGNKILDSVEKFDPQTRQWNFMRPMLTKRYNFGVATLRGKIYVCGGYNGKNYLQSAEVYDTKTQKWDSIAPMNERRQHFSLVANYGLLYAIGGDADRRGNTVEVFDPEQKCWILLPPIFAFNCRVFAAVLSDE